MTSMLSRHPFSVAVVSARLGLQARSALLWLACAVVLLSSMARPAQAQLRGLALRDGPQRVAASPLASGVDTDRVLGLALTPRLMAYGLMGSVGLSNPDTANPNAALHWPASRLGAGLQWQLSSVSALRFELNSLHSGVSDRVGVALQLRL
jgi:hypothetical protein